MSKFTYDCFVCGYRLVTDKVAEVIAFDKEHPCFVDERETGGAS